MIQNTLCVKSLTKKKHSCQDDDQCYHYSWFIVEHVSGTILWFTWQTKVHKKNAADVIELHYNGHTWLPSIFNQPIGYHSIASQLIQNAGADYYAMEKSNLVVKVSSN